jgi:hypothetical protein
MSHAGRFVFGVAAAVWLTWACGSSNSGDFGPVAGTSADAGEAGDRGAAFGGEVGAGATNGNGGSTQQTGGAGNDGPGGAGNAGSDVGQGGTDSPLPTCNGVGATCVQSTECCSGVCDPKTNKCASVVGVCSPAGADCATATECCSFQCSDAGKCGANTCVSDAQACQGDSECCSGSCVDGNCGTLNTECKTAGNTCTGDGDCCSGDCGDGGTCTLGQSYCIQPGDVCAHANDCCTGLCSIADGKTLGVCGEQPSGSAFCTGVDGVLCNDCGDCCSRLCAPFGPSGAKICQPANGCHVTGDLCRRNEDCCGGTDDESLPGWGNVICEKEAGQDVGLCRNPSNGGSPGGACNPQGNVCHFQNYSCSISSARANCCGGLGAKGGVCELDPLGIPRCNGLGEECRQAGDSCASTADCCDDRPCVPDANGDLHCGTGECQRSGNTCTINADCCPGSICIHAPGSIVGTCGGDPGDPGGSGGAGNGDGGAPSTGVGGADTGSCSEYGQLCDDSSDCCNAVPCSEGLCRYAGG